MLGYFPHRRLDLTDCSLQNPTGHLPSLIGEELPEAINSIGEIIVHQPDNGGEVAHQERFLERCLKIGAAHLIG